MSNFFRNLFRRARGRIHKNRQEDLPEHVPDSARFHCSICGDMLTAPVTTPCGHNFCRDCITQHWDTQVQCDCPQCGESFREKPLAVVNTLLSQVVAQFRPATTPEGVLCDVCTGTKVKAVKSCGVCLLSCCRPHLEPHLTKSVLKKHRLLDPVEDLEARMCPKHQKPLDMFCISEQKSICVACAVSEHRSHNVLALSDYEEHKLELKKTEAENQKRRVKVEEIRESREKSRAAAGRERAEGVEVFRALIEHAERALEQLKERIEEEEEARETRAGGLLKHLEEEISELTKRSSEVQQLLQSGEQLSLQGDSSSLKAAPPTQDWTEVHVPPSSHEGTAARAVAQLQETVSQELKKLSEAELKTKKQQFAVDVTLDPDTANPYLVLSDDGKRVSNGDVRKQLPDHPKRFSSCVSVSGRQRFSSGKSYFEVEVKGKTDWTLGVSKESISRKGKVRVSPDGGFWTIWLRNGNQYCATDNSPVPLSLSSAPEKVGVFVDYEEGRVSFYDVDAAALIHSYTDCCFTDPLVPHFCPGLNEGGKNSAPLIICPVDQCLIGSRSGDSLSPTQAVSSNPIQSNSI